MRCSRYCCNCLQRDVLVITVIPYDVMRDVVVAVVVAIVGAIAVVFGSVHVNNTVL